MKKFLGILVLGLFLITPSWADDIRDFQIEGISIGDSLLKYYSKEEIDQSQKISHKDKKYIFVNFSENLEEYQRMQIGYKNNDKNYKIELINGVIFFDQDIDKCHSKQDDIANDIVSNFTNLVVDGPEYAEIQPADNLDPVNTRWLFIESKKNSNTLIKIYCTDHPLTNKRHDQLKIQILTDNMGKYLISKN